MRRKPLLAALGFLLLFMLSRLLLTPAPVPTVVFVGGRVAFAQGKDLRWYGPEGVPGESLRLSKSPDSLLAVQDRLALATDSRPELILPRGDREAESLPPPRDSKGESRWACWGNLLYHLQLRPSALQVRDLIQGDWKEFLAADEEMENPVDLSAFEGGLLVLNQDPPEAVWLDAQGKSQDRVPLTRTRIWPIQRPVFESPLDYLRPRRPETPRRIWAEDAQTAAILFTTTNGESPRLVILSRGAGTPIREVFLALRPEGRKRNAVFGDFAWLPGGESTLTSNQGGLWRYGPNFIVKKEWEKLSPPPGNLERWSRLLLPGGSLLAVFIALAWAAWPATLDRDRSPGIPPRAWALGAASLVLPGLGQAIQKRWAWALFWFGFLSAWVLLTVFLTHRLGSDSYVSPATYIESWTGILGSSMGSAFHAFWGEWSRRI